MQHVIRVICLCTSNGIFSGLSENHAMELMMKLRNVIIVSVFLGQLGCSKEGIDIHAFRDDTSIESINGSWKVISFENYIDSTIEFKNQANSRGLDIIIAFDDTQDPHKFSGTNTTNAIRGDFEYRGKRKFIVINFWSTLVAQPVWADKFGEAISDGEVDFKINETGLRIYYNNDTESVTLTRE